MRKHIFNAGPSVLPEIVLQEASDAIKELNSTGVSIAEVSHRGEEFAAILKEAKQLVSELLGLSDDQEVLFLQGGASTQFFMVASNFLTDDSTAGYIDTGVWSSKAIKEAKLFGNVAIISSSKETNYNYIPKGYKIQKELNYLHVTSNNTIYGTQFHKFPETVVPLIVDMSSDIFSREIDMNKFDLIYAGAQKNLGPAGVTLVIIKRSMLDRINKELPSMTDYRVHVDKNSVYNTPPVFSIYVCLLTLRWLKNMGGIAKIEEINNEKAAKIYGVIDKFPLYQGTAEVEDRSKMNATFLLTNTDLNEDLLKTVAENNIIGIKGHRSVGGFRVSMYNALHKESVDLLVNVLTEFALKHS